MQKYLFLAVILFFSFCSKGQQYLSIGDKMPNDKRFKISEYKGKALLIDFWGVTCSSCIEAMPMLQAIQEKYKDKLQIVLVTRDNIQKVNKLKEKSKIVRETNLPMVVGDTVFSNTFYYESAPTEVWIDKFGIVRYITEGWFVTDKNIQAFIQGINLNLPLKDESTESMAHELQTLQATDTLSRTMFYSYLNPYIPAASSMISHVYDKKGITLRGIKLFNYSLLGFFKEAYPEVEGLNSRVILDVKHPEIFSLPDDTLQWGNYAKANTYCYELKLPANNTKNLYKYMQEDIRRFFGYSGTLEKRRVASLIIYDADTTRLRTAGGTRVYRRENDETLITIRNVNLSQILRDIKRANYGHNKSSPPIIIEVLFKGNVDMDINCAYINISNLKKELAKYGLEIKEEEREMFILRIKEWQE